VKLHTVIKTFDGATKVVAVGLTLPEAEQFIRTARTQLTKTNKPDSNGEDQFEVAQFTIKEERHG
jgi:hypothetical protein